MRASSPHCCASRSMAAILSRARALACALCGHSAAFSVASWRRVGMASSSHGVKNASSSSASRHCRVSACAQPPGSSVAGRCADGVGGQALEAVPGRRERPRRRSARGLQFLAQWRRVPEQPERVAQAIEQPRRQYRVVGQREQARTQGQQMAGEVAAVHCRDVPRRQRLQRLRVVPVVEVPPVPLQPVHRAQGARRALDELPGGKVAEVVGRQIRQQGQPDVGRRRAMRDRGDAILLIVVGRQPVVFRADEALEEGPGATRKFAQEAHLLERQGRLAAGERTADPPRDDG